MNFQMIQAVINSFRQSTVKRIEENSNDAFDAHDKIMRRHPSRKPAIQGLTLLSRRDAVL